MYSNQILASIVLSLLPFFLCAQQDLKDKTISTADSTEFKELLRSLGHEVHTDASTYQIKFNGSIKGWKIRIKPQSPDSYFSQFISEDILYAEIKEPGQYELEFINEEGEIYQSFVKIGDQKVLKQALPFQYKEPKVGSKLLSERLKRGDTLVVIRTEYRMSCGVSMRIERHSFIRKKGKLEHKVESSVDGISIKKTKFKAAEETELDAFVKTERNLERRPIDIFASDLSSLEFQPSYVFILGDKRLEGWATISWENDKK